jgi:hypothetical protein
MAETAAAWATESGLIPCRAPDVSSSRRLTPGRSSKIDP